MNWYHAVSTDMLHWAHLPVALTPDHPYDCGGEFSGSATVLPDGTPVLSVSVACGKWVFFAIPEFDRKTDPLMLNWTKSGTMPGSNGAKFDGPIFSKPACSPGGFRDPTSAWKGPDGVWRMATGCGGPPPNAPAPPSAGTKIGTMMLDTDLPGGDLPGKTTHHPGTFGAAGCQALCAADSKCDSWTWVIRGAPAGSGDCCLKKGVTCPAKPPAGLKCTSGAKAAITKDCSHSSKGAKGGACLFKSHNFVNWTSEGFLHQSVERNNPGFWECPDMFQLPGSDKWVLKGSCGGDWWTVGDYTMGATDSYKPLSYDMHGGDPSGMGKQQYDFGKFYASKSFYDPSKDRQVLWGWVAEEGSAPHAGEDWSSIQSIPRTIKLDPFNGTRLVFEPIEEVKTLRSGAPVKHTGTIAAGKSVMMPTAKCGTQCDIVLTIQGDFTKPGMQVGVSVMQDAGGKGFACTVGSGPDATMGEVAISGGGSGPFLLATSPSSVSLRVLVDRSVIEAFAQGGRGVVTHRVYPDKAATGISLVNTGKVDATVTAEIYTMATANPPTDETLREHISWV